MPDDAPVINIFLFFNDNIYLVIDIIDLGDFIAATLFHSQFV